MEKQIYLLGLESQSSDLRDPLLGPVSDAILEDSAVLELEVYVADQKVTTPNPDASSIYYPVGPQEFVQASVSVWVDSLNGRENIEGALNSIASNLAGYSVTETLPR